MVEDLQREQEGGVIAMSRKLQVETETELMHGGAQWIAVVIGCALLFGPTIWVVVTSLR